MTRRRATAGGAAAAVAVAKDRPRRSGRLKAMKQRGNGPKLLDLPIEILVMIFHIICLEPASKGPGPGPGPGHEETDSDTTSTTAASTIAGADGAAAAAAAAAAVTEELATPQLRREATDFLLVCRYLYNHLNPLYWQKRTISFKDPTKLANEFLGFASDMTVRNLSQLRFVIYINSRHIDRMGDLITGYASAPQSPIKKVAKLCEVVNLYQAELKNLQSLTIQLDMSPWMLIAIFFRSPGRDPLGGPYALSLRDLSAREAWALVDRSCNGCFGRLEKAVRRVLLKRCKEFHISATVDVRQDDFTAIPPFHQLRMEGRQMTLTFAGDQ